MRRVLHIQQDKIASFTSDGGNVSSRLEQASTVIVEVEANEPRTTRQSRAHD